MYVNKSSACVKIRDFEQFAYRLPETTGGCEAQERWSCDTVSLSQSLSS